MDGWDQGPKSPFLSTREYPDVSLSSYFPGGSDPTVRPGDGVVSTVVTFYSTGIHRRQSLCPVGFPRDGSPPLGSRVTRGPGPPVVFRTLGDETGVSDRPRLFKERRHDKRPRDFTGVCEIYPVTFLC